jgi:triacylglycerol lipase
MTFDPDVAKNLLELSRIAYLAETLARDGITALALRDPLFFSSGGTQATSCGDDTRILVAFRGTEADPRDWITDSRFGPRRGELDAMVHSGFHEALDLVWPDVGEALAASGGREVWLAGHSLGAALAVLAAARIVEAGGTVTGVYTYGQPRIGKADFRAAYEERLGDITFRVVNHIDLVTRVPLLIQGYRHVGRMVYFDHDRRGHVDASAWHVAIDDLRYRLTHFGRVESAGLTPHYTGSYAALFA